MRTFTAIVTLAALLVLSACGSAASPNNDSNVSPPPAEEQTAPAPGMQEEQGEQEEQTPPGDSEPAEGDDEQAGQEETANDEEAGDDGDDVAVTHYMDKNYIFRPLHEDGDKKVVLLTFDDGPKDAEMIDPMLETLQKHNAKAIFFVNGFRVKANPDLLVKLYEHGHAIGNHSWDHLVLPEQSEEVIDRQIADVQAIVEELTGEAPKFFRPPHGAGNDYIRKKVSEHGMLYMTWSNGSLDWERGYQTPESVVEQVLRQLHPGSNILMHELQWTVEALDTLLTRLEEEGYSFLDPRAIQLPAEEESAAEGQLSSPNE